MFTDQSGPPELMMIEQHFDYRCQVGTFVLQTLPEVCVLTATLILQTNTFHQLIDGATFGALDYLNISVHIVICRILSGSGSDFDML